MNPSPRGAKIPERWMICMYFFLPEWSNPGGKPYREVPKGILLQLFWLCFNGVWCKLSKAKSPQNTPRKQIARRPHALPQEGLKYRIGKGSTQAVLVLTVCRTGFGWPCGKRDYSLLAGCVFAAC